MDLEFGLLLLCLMLLVQMSYAQLSPGKLSKAHAGLEGISNCTQCHTIGNKVVNQKCLTCHKDLGQQIARNKGFHVSALVKNKECVSCHNEHHGENFELIRLDKKTFNHNSTGYELKGAHKTKAQNCKECHQPAHMANPVLKKKPNTYLGLSTQCASCHEDVHQKTLSNDCASCHDTQDFKGATLFNHDQAEFPLDGAHQKVTCASCHKTEMRNGKSWTKYKGISYVTCASCHKDVHKGEFGTNCKSCHTSDSFHKISPSKGFNHSLTGFTLEGKHDDIACKKCHESSSYQDFKNKKNISCVTCHKDVHEGKLGNDCKSCHNQTSFLLKNKKFVGKFDHDKTDYPLKGKHIRVDCRECHKADFTDKLAHNACMDCHKDGHNGDFANKKTKYPDCASCHQVESFSPSLYTIEKHQESAFPLDGAHVAQPCFSCHKTGKTWVFANMKTTCVACHSDVHEGKIDSSYYPKQSCTSCHTSSEWSSIQFDHAKTKFPLAGGHSRVACKSCHWVKTEQGLEQLFKGLSQQCATCHQDVHGKQFEHNGRTDCAVCHTVNAWNVTKFDHNTTNYRLDGQHKLVSCAKCHKATLANNPSIRLYKIEKYECIDCHL